jgi:hypothetical protein
MSATSLTTLNPTYFSPNSWQQRVQQYLSGTADGTFLKANQTAIARSLDDPRTGLRMVVNIPADALLGFLREGRYLNAYDRPRVGGEPRRPSHMRVKIDGALGLDDPRDYFFGAVAMGGTGVRFYGEYCMVLKADAISRETRVFDRNSYDLSRPPFEKMNTVSLVSMLRGEWGQDLIHMVAMKLLPELSNRQWLVTLGTVSDALLHDEEFIEVHKQGRFGPPELEEVRQAPEDEALQMHIMARYEDGEAPSIEEMLWMTRRNHVRQALVKARIPNRVVVSSGRGDRWK